MTEDAEARRQNVSKNRSLTLRLAALAVGMFGFGFLLVPLYYVICEVTGIGGRTSNTVAAAPTAAMATSAVDEEREITVEFVATVNEYAPWEFRPEVQKLTIEPGKMYDVSFFARNLTERELVGQAIPSVAPGEGAKYLKKIDCFCFREQKFAPTEARNLTVKFYVDPALPEYVDRLTLSYTMFVKPEAAAAAVRS